MSSVPVFVGLDYHQDSVQVCVLDREGKVLNNQSVANEAGLIASVMTRRGQPVRAAIEACCGAAALAQELSDHGLLVELAHPGYVSRLKRSPDKTDWGDARLLADLTRVGYVPKVWLAPEETRQLRRLMRMRQQLVARRRDVKLRMRALLRENRLRSDGKFAAWTKGWLAWLADLPLAASDRFLLDDHLAELATLGKRIDQLDRYLTERVQADPRVKRFLAMPGVGLVTAVTLRAEIGRFDRFRNGKQLARFCGVTPRNASSGNRQADAGLIKAGNPQLRMVLVELAHRLIRGSGDMSKLAGSMLSRGKPKNVVVAAIANRWVRRLYYEMQKPMDLTPK